MKNNNTNKPTGASLIPCSLLVIKVTIAMLVSAPMAGASDAAGAAGMIPVGDFFAAPAISQPQISDDGKNLVMIVPGANGKRSIACVDIDNQKASFVFMPNDYDVDFVSWKDSRIVFGGDAGGNESFALRSIKPDGKGLVDLSESYGDNDRITTNSSPGVAIIVSMLRDEPNHVLIEGLGASKSSTGGMRANFSDYGLYLMDVLSGERKRRELYPKSKDLHYVVDSHSGIAYARIMLSGENALFQIRAPGTRAFVDIATGEAASLGFDVLPLGMDPDRTALYVVRYGGEAGDLGTLYKVEFKNPNWGNAVYKPDEGEIKKLVRGRSGKIYGLLCEAVKKKFIWFDKDMAQTHASLLATFPGKDVLVTDSSRDDSRLVIVVESDTDSGEYYVYDRKAVQLIPVGRRFPNLDPEKMAAMTPMQYAARDGLLIHGFLTRPPGAGDRATPLIILPHGGPFGIRDEWGFDPETQFLANRGYSVLQVNYRGSGGYGSNFLKAGRCQWGLKMQDDLADAVKWAVDKGYADPKRVAIYGGSYGGYAALAGLVWTPDLYKCGVNIAGVTDLRYVAKPIKGRIQGAFSRAYAENWIGRNPKDLHDRSPVNFVANIKAPSLHAYGENDPRVDILNWRDLESKLKKFKKPYEVFRETDEGHGFKNESARVNLYKAIDAFLDKHLKN